MQLFFSNRDTDYHSLLKAAEKSSFAGIIKVHDAKDGYVVSFTDCLDNAQDIFLSRLEDIKRNVQTH